MSFICESFSCHFSISTVQSSSAFGESLVYKEVKLYNYRVWVFTLKEVIWLDVTGHMTPPPKRNVYTSINGHFSTSSWHYLIAVANTIQNDQLFQVQGLNYDLRWYMYLTSVIIRTKCLILSVYWRINVIWRVTKLCVNLLCYAAQVLRIWYPSSDVYTSINWQNEIFNS